MKATLQRLALPAFGFALLLLIWEIAGRIAGPALFAPPSSVAVDYVGLLRQGDMLRELSSSLRQMAVGFIAACIVGMPLGAIMGRSAVADAMTQANARNVAITAMFAGFGLDASALTAALASGKSVAELAVEQSTAAATARNAAIDAARAEGHAAGLTVVKAGKRTAAVTALETDEERASKAAASLENEDEVGAVTAEAVAARITAA